jgi:hypothetical protein
MSREDLLKKYGDPKTLDDLAKIVISEISLENPLLGFRWDIGYSPTVSNSHSCPHNGEINWGAKADRPTYYPGFIGRVWLEFKNNHYFGRPFKSTFTYIGTGGYGAYGATCFWGPQVGASRYSWDYKLWLDDWISIMDELKSEMVYHNLINYPKPFQKNHVFNWRIEEMSSEKLLDSIT